MGTYPVTIGEVAPGNDTNTTLIEFNDSAVPSPVSAIASTGNDSFAARRDHVHGITGNISVQMINVRVDGIQIGQQPTINFINGGGCTISAVNNAGQNRVDVTITVP